MHMHHPLPMVLLIDAAVSILVTVRTHQMVGKASSRRAGMRLLSASLRRTSLVTWFSRKHRLPKGSGTEFLKYQVQLNTKLGEDEKKKRNIHKLFVHISLLKP